MTTARIHPDVIFDRRLAIFHQRARWLALADLHFGYEVEFRRAGGLIPLFGMETIESRLCGLIDDFEPETVVFAGDIAHGTTSAREVSAFCGRIRQRAPNLVLIAGNHDRGPISRALDFRDFLRIGEFFIHHGHEAQLGPEPGEIEIIGHHHPAATLRDGAGLRLKLPSLVQERGENGAERWILPAFSPWAGGTAWKRARKQETRQWVCSPDRVFELTRL